MAASHVPTPSFATRAPRWNGATLDRWLLRACLWLPLIALLLFFALPMLSVAWRSLTNDSTGAIGLGNYQALLHTPGIWRAVANSLLLGGSTTAITVLLGFVIAYGIERTAMPGKRLIGMTLSLPVLAPSLVLGLGLIFLLGRNGVVGKMLDMRPDIYGFWGLLIADVLYALPQAVLIIRAALRYGDARQYEAAEMLGAGGWRQFFDITLPGVRYGLLSAAFVVFTVTITDFGNAVVIGGNFSVLATEIYNQVSGQMKFGMGAVVGIVLLLPAALSVWIERVAARRQAMAGGEGALPPVPRHLPARDIPVFLLSLTVAVSIALVIFTVVMASFIRLWPYRLDFTLRHYNIDLAGGYASLWTSVWLSAMPVAVPGLVLGLSYVFAFNTADWPWGALYGSALLIALCNYMHYHTQGYATMMTGMRNVPGALEDAVTVLGGGVGRTLSDVYLPAVRTTLVAVGLFLFMRSMVTLSAVIFLVTPDVPLAAVTVMRLDEAGFTSQAAAFSTCIMAIVATMAALLHALVRPRR
ncbi:MAG: Sulfate transport system permease protein CysW [Paracidovorax wautersii]|uniref:Sulfate transport system permease protein CysW n=1 Tax=Paracidovorax wautersii TaxID=1177982 RepID=A0A7V8FN03_9BURK|nr:MAG: Sulfate transport system permease protein CysW [Paracidovorax wautersii]